MEELTLSFCLREIANNIEKEGHMYIRIGIWFLDYDPERDCYVVHFKDGSCTTSSDLLPAINEFIAAVTYNL